MANFTYIEQGYGGWPFRSNGLKAGNISAIVEVLQAHYAVQDAFHEKATLYIRFIDSADIHANRAAIEKAFTVNTY